MGGGGDADGTSVRNAVFLFFCAPFRDILSPWAWFCSFVLSSKIRWGASHRAPIDSRSFVATVPFFRIVESRARAPAGTNEQLWCARYSGTARARLSRFN